MPQESIQPKVSHFQSNAAPRYELPLNKHIKGVEVILESEPILECSQMIDLHDALQNQLTSRRAAAAKDENVQDDARDAPQRAIQQPKQSLLKSKLLQPVSIRNNSASLVGKQMTRQKSAGKLVQRAPVKQYSQSVFKTESKPAHKRVKTANNIVDHASLDIGRPCQTEQVESEVDLPLAYNPVWNRSQPGSEGP